MTTAGTPTMSPKLRAAAASTFCLLGLGCAATQASNLPLDHIDLGAGYRPESQNERHDVGDIALLMSFSGGGTRAAAVAYGVMQELRDTPVTSRGKSERLLDEIDVITSVSGGSFTAAYYGLHGDRLFDDFEDRFLRLDVSNGLLLRLLMPQNWLRLLTPFYNRSNLAIDYYDDKIFDGATYADMEKANGPLVQINSTNISAGTRFTFIQPNFDLICSDLSKVRVAEAVTASSAVPVVFPTIILENYAGRCSYEEPEWLEEALEMRKTRPRRYHIASTMRSYTDSDEHPYLHLVDGGISDNLGVRGPLDSVIVGGGIWDRLKQLGTEPPRHLVFIVVNSATEPARPFRLRPKPPGIGELLSSITDTQLHRYNYETMELLDENMQRWAASLDRHGDPVQVHLIEIAEHQIDDPGDRKFFNNVPTSLSLDDETVDRLIEIGRRLLRESPDFKNLVSRLQP